MKNLRTLLLLLFMTPMFNLGTSQISIDFPSSSIGTVTHYAKNYFTLSLRNDNDNPKLVPRWRSWWSIKVENENKDTLHFTLANLGWPNFSLPFSSTDQKTWQRLDEKNVSQSEQCRFNIKKCHLYFNQRINNNPIYLASFIPYPVEKLETYVNRIANHPSVQVETLGYSEYYHFPIYHLQITEPTATEKIARIWIHARAHPGETPGNFMLEGLIDYLLSDDATAKSLREHLIFHIVPMQNPDGVYVGNYRSNPKSVNQELSWFFDKKNPKILQTKAPHENKLMNTLMQRLLTDKIPVKIALNFHASHSEPNTAAFAFPHFGDDALKYSAEQVDLWNNQLRFIDELTRFYDYRFEPPPREGYNTFLANYYPETWWWYNAQNKVMALTLEATYGKAGYNHWVTDKEHRDLGQAIAKTISTYLNLNNAAPLPPYKKNHRPFNPEPYSSK